MDNEDANQQQTRNLKGKEEGEMTAKMKRKMMGPRNEGQRGEERKRGRVKEHWRVVRGAQEWVQ